MRAKLRSKPASIPVCVPEPPPLELADKDWSVYLKELEKSLWRDGYESRQLSEEEWTRLQTILTARADLLVIEPVNACMGFGFGLVVRKVAVPVYPGVDPDPERLLFFTNKHLPFSPGKDRVLFLEGWERMSPFSHTEDNGKRLVANGFKALQERWYYDY